MAAFRMERFLIISLMLNMVVLAIAQNSVPSTGGSPSDTSSTVGGGNEAGASGSDHESFGLSRGGLIAIITVIVAVVVFGSILPDQRPIYPLLRVSSHLNSPFLSCKEKIVGAQGAYAELCKESVDCSNTEAIRIPKGCSNTKKGFEGISTPG
jgi:hypothetical protein